MSPCSKIEYATRGEALRGARHFMHTLRRNQKRKSHDGVLRPYRCTKCDFWHLTSAKVEK